MGEAEQNIPWLNGLHSVSELILMEKNIPNYRPNSMYFGT
jgi:hypothetical protein